MCLFLAFSALDGDVGLGFDASDNYFSSQVKGKPSISELIYFQRFSFIVLPQIMFII